LETLLILVRAAFTDACVLLTMHLHPGSSHPEQTHPGARTVSPSMWCQQIV
jgi:hypothetical protein